MNLIACFSHKNLQKGKKLKENLCRIMILGYYSSKELLNENLTKYTRQKKSEKKKKLSICYSSDETTNDQTFLVVPIAILPTP